MLCYMLMNRKITINNIEGNNPIPTNADLLEKTEVDDTTYIFFEDLKDVFIPDGFDICCMHDRENVCLTFKPDEGKDKGKEFTLVVHPKHLLEFFKREKGDLKHAVKLIDREIAREEATSKFIDI